MKVFSNEASWLLTVKDVVVVLERAHDTSVTPAPPITAQIPGLGSIICTEFVLSNAPSPRICAATQPEKLKF